MKLRFNYIIILYLIVFSSIFFNFFIPDNDENNKRFIDLFERKQKIDTIKNISYRALKTCFASNNIRNGKTYSKEYFILENFERVQIGTDIYYSSLGNILELGTWQSKTDSFMLNNTDTMIVFSNPFSKIKCHIEYDSNLKSGYFTPGFVTGYAFIWTESNKLIKKIVKDKSNQDFEIKYDTLTGKAVSKLKL